MSSTDNPTVKTTKKAPVKATGPTIKDLLAKVENIEKCLAKMAHYQGGAIPRVLREFGLAEWSPDKSDMKKYKQG